MLHELAGWVGVIDPIAWWVYAIWKSWLRHVDRRDVLTKALGTTDSADKADVIKAWAAVETAQSTGLRQLRK